MVGLRWSRLGRFELQAARFVRLDCPWCLEICGVTCALLHKSSRQPCLSAMERMWIVPSDEVIEEEMSDLSPRTTSWPFWASEARGSGFDPLLEWYARSLIEHAC